MKRITIILFLMLLPGLLFGCSDARPGSDSLLSDLTQPDSGSAMAEQSSLTSALDEDESELSSVGIQMPSYTETRNEDGLYQYDENSRLIHYQQLGTLTDEIPSENWLTEAQLRDKAEEYLKTRVPLEQYVYTKTRDYPYRYEKAFYYERFINGYSSFDFIRIVVSYDGTIRSFDAPRVGIFDNVTIPEINRDKILEKLNIIIPQKLGDIPYEIRDNWWLVLLENGTPAMQVEVMLNGSQTDNDIFHVLIE